MADRVALSGPPRRPRRAGALGQPRRQVQDATSSRALSLETAAAVHTLSRPSRGSMTARAAARVVGGVFMISSSAASTPRPGSSTLSWSLLHVNEA
jgi:hypothetical protein